MPTQIGGPVTPAGTKADCERAFRVPMMFHPSHDVFDLDEAERWYEKVFGCASTSLLSAIAKLPPRPGAGYPPNYSTFTPIRDVLFDTIDPTRYVFEGVQRLPSISEPHLRLISWYVEGMDEAFQAMQRHGIRVTDQLDKLATGDKAPLAFGSDMPIFYTVAEDVGLRYAFSPPADVTAIDPRTAPGWNLAPVAPNDPLGLDICSHHTLLTARPARALRLLRDVLGGTVIRENRNALLGTTSTYVHLAGSTIELAVPDRGTRAHADWQMRAPLDTYHAVTWKVADLDRAERHLAAHGVRIEVRSDKAIMTDPATSLGIPWGFTTELTEGDPRLGHG